MFKKKIQQRTYKEKIIIEHVDTDKAEEAANEIVSKGYELFSAHTSASQWGGLLEMILVFKKI